MFENRNTPPTIGFLPDVTLLFFWAHKHLPLKFLHDVSQLLSILTTHCRQTEKILWNKQSSITLFSTICGLLWQHTEAFSHFWLLNWHLDLSSYYLLMPTDTGIPVTHSPESHATISLDPNIKEIGSDPERDGKTSSWTRIHGTGLIKLKYS